MREKIAVVGAGIFGVTTAWFLGKAGHYVDLYEKRGDILASTSGKNQFRLHRGYHYPRSEETIVACHEGEKKFRRVYSDSVIDANEHFYCIAKEGSLSTASQYLDVLKRNNLEYKTVYPTFINREKVELCVKARESVLDIEKLKETCWAKLKNYGVNVNLNKKVNYENLDDYDLVIIATYSLNNSLLNNFPQAQRDYQFELVEKLVLKLPEKFQNKSVTVMDGPFCVIDPFGATGLFLMGNVVHAIHKTNIGRLPDIPPQFKELLYKGIVKNPPITNFQKFIDFASDYFIGIEDAEHVGSMFTIRTVLPYREYDDARPTIVERVDDRTVTLFSGKIPTCIDAAEQILSIVGGSQ